MSRICWVFNGPYSSDFVELYRRFRLWRVAFAGCVSEVTSYTFSFRSIIDRGRGGTNKRVSKEIFERFYRQHKTKGENLLVFGSESSKIPFHLPGQVIFFGFSPPPSHRFAVGLFLLRFISIISTSGKLVFCAERPLPAGSRRLEVRLHYGSERERTRILCIEMYQGTYVNGRPNAIERPIDTIRSPSTLFEHVAKAVSDSAGCVPLW